MPAKSPSPQHPILPLRNIVVFPHMIVPLFVGREKSVAALESVMNAGKQIVLVTQKTEDEDNPSTKDLYSIGTLGTVLQMLKLPDGTVKVLVEGQQRVRLTDIEDDGAMFTATVEDFPELQGDEAELEGLIRTVMSEFEEYVKLNKKIPPEVMVSLGNIDEPSRLADTIAGHLNLKLEEKQELLELDQVEDRLEKLYQLMENEIGLLNVEKRIRKRVKDQMEKTQKDYYLNEQMRAIQKELGEEDDELDELEEKIKKAAFPKEAQERAEKELKKLKMMSPMSSEATVIRNYLDWMLDIPWGDKAAKKLKKDLDFAQEVLDEDHYGLEKVKERIVENLAVQQRTKSNNGPILCLVGPPGVGKTSLAASIARATGRDYVRMALGGVRDEAEIRGHRRTYIGALPGKIIQGMKRAGTTNPLFLLDEIDKLGNDFRGDPSSALLEVLDPAQNHTFQDHYLEVDYNLSDVLFLCTANYLQQIPPALRDRMELIRLEGYTEDEKVEIAKRHLVAKAFKDTGLKAEEVTIPEETLRETIRYYTREAGVRKLEQLIQALCRKVVTELIKEEKKTKATKGKKTTRKKTVSCLKNITPDCLQDYLGVKQYKWGEKDDDDQVGLVNGLAWTEVGGDILQIEATALEGKGKLMTTGKLGDVMQESIQAASSYVRRMAKELKVDGKFYEKNDIHIHVPDGATPKDGPSAGLAMVTAMVSALTGQAVRHDVAMTGEVSLRGRALQIGGLKEKLLAALRSGIKVVFIPEDNAKDLAEMPKNIMEGLDIRPVSNVTEVLDYVLVKAKPTTKTSSKSPSSKTMAKSGKKKTAEARVH